MVIILLPSIKIIIAPVLCKVEADFSETLFHFNEIIHFSFNTHHVYLHEIHVRVFDHCI